MMFQALVDRLQFCRARAVGRNLPQNLISLILAAPLCVALFVHGSTKPSPPTPVITEKGINLDSLAVDSRKVALAWSTSDERIKPGAIFMVQRSTDGGANWHTVYATTESNAVINCFSVDRDTRWRIAVDAGEVEE